MSFVSLDDGYIPSFLTRSIYAKYGHVEAPNPCRKYHISSDLTSARAIANACLPLLQSHRLAHKIVETPALLSKQSKGSQAGKFITIYTPSGMGPNAPVVQELDTRLVLLRRQGLANATHVPRHRPSHHVFMEAPVGASLMIFGGFVCDPND